MIAGSVCPAQVHTPSARERQRTADGGPRWGRRAASSMWLLLDGKGMALSHRRGEAMVESPEEAQLRVAGA